MKAVKDAKNVPTPITVAVFLKCCFLLSKALAFM